MHKLSRAVVEQAQDPMCYPQMVDDPFRLKGETYAQSLREYIEFVLGSHSAASPMDAMTIY